MIVHNMIMHMQYKISLKKSKQISFERQNKNLNVLNLFTNREFMIYIDNIN